MRLLLLAGFALSASFASAQLTHVGPQMPENSSNVVWSSIRSGTTSKIETSGAFLLNNINDFQTYWLKSTGQRNFPKINIDWNKDRMLAIHLGKRPTGGYMAQIQKIRYQSGLAAEVTVLERTPPAGMVTTQGITSPWILLRVQRAAYDFDLNIQQMPQSTGIFFPGNGGNGGNGGGCNCSGCSCGCGCGG